MVYLTKGYQSLGDLLYRIYCKYTPSSWFNCNKCSIWLNEFGSVGYVTPEGSIIHCIPALNTNIIDGLPPCTAKMLTEMRQVTAECINGALKDMRMPLFNNYTMAGPDDRGHFCTIYPGKVPNMLAPFASVDEFHERIRAATDAMEFILPWTALLVDKDGYPGQLATRIFTITIENVSLAGFNSILAMCFLDTYQQSKLNWPVNFRKLMNLINPRTNAALTIMIPQTGWNSDCNKKYGMIIYTVKYNDILAMLHCWSSSGMLHQVLDAVKTVITPDTTEVTQHQADKIRMALPDHIRLAHMQHKKTALDSTIHINQIQDDMSRRYGITNVCCDMIGPSVIPSSLQHITFSSSFPPTTYSITHTGNISMVSLCQQLLNLSSTGVHPWCLLQLPNMIFIGSLTSPKQTNMTQILQSYPCYWFYRVGSVSSDQAFCGKRIALTALSCQPDNPNTLDNNTNACWLFHTPADYNTRHILSAFANSNTILDPFVPFTQYKRYITTQSGKFTMGNLVIIPLSCNPAGLFDNTNKFTVIIGGLPNGAVISADITQRVPFTGELDIVQIDKLHKPAVIASSPLDSDDNICVICMDKPRTHLASPCGHFSYCETCIGKISSCSVCRITIMYKVKVHQ